VISLTAAALLCNPAATALSAERLPWIAKARFAPRDEALQSTHGPNSRFRLLQPETNRFHQQRSAPQKAHE
jgi:hypothetical protein